MKNIRNNLKNIKNISLSEKERTDVWAKLSAYTEFKPINPERIDALNRLPTVKPAIGFNLFSKTKSMPLIASFLIASFLGGGTAFAAEGAVPGDVLYPIKTEINENIRGTLAIDTEARANFDAWRAERRLNEARVLSSRGDLSEEKEQQLEKRFDQHAQNVEARIAFIAETNPALAAELSTKFEASLLAHEAILTDISGTTTADVRDAVRVKIDSVAGLRIKAVSDVTVDDPSTPTVDRSSAAKRMYGSAQTHLRTTKELYGKVQSELTEEQITRVDAHFESTLEVFARAENAYTEENYGDAFLGFRKVVSAMNNLAVFLKTEISDDDGNTRPVIRVREIHPVDPIPFPREIPPVEILPVKIDVKTDSQIDPPSLDLDAGPADTDVKSDSRINIQKRIRVQF